AEHGGFIGANDVAFDDWFDAFARNDRVHVRAHHDGFSARNRAREARDDVAGVAVDFFSGVINLHLRSHFFAVLLDAFGHLAFFARVAVDLHKFKQQVLDTFLVDHSSSEGVSARAILLHQDATRRVAFASEGGPEFDIGNPSPFGRGQGEGAAKNRKKFSSPFTTIRCTKTFSHYALTPALSQRERETQRHSSSC